MALAAWWSTRRRGPGKSTLVVRAAALLAAAGEPLIVVAQTNSQVDDLVHRLATQAPELAIGRLSAQDYQPSPQVAGHAHVRVAQRVGDLADRTVLVGTAAKWATVGDGQWRWAIVDEAYQMRSDMLLRFAGRFGMASSWATPANSTRSPPSTSTGGPGLTWDPMQSAVSVLLRNNRDLPVRRLPVSWRLPASAAPVVAEAFYPFTGFRSGTEPGERRLEFGTRMLGRGRLTRQSTWLRTRAGRFTSCLGGTPSGPTPRPCRRARPWPNECFSGG